MTIESPCVTCGACCCFFRVSFHWMECDPLGVNGPLPEHTVRRDHHQVCMRGTTSKPVRCIELTGDVGGRMGCLIYPSRATPCRNFGVQMDADGNGWTISASDLDYCNEARRQFRLSPLVPPTPATPPATPFGFEPPAPKAA